MRQDGGDAETGAGMDVGAGLLVSDSSTGLAVFGVWVRVRMLVVHQDEGFRERGVLWGGETMAGMAHGGLASGNRLDGQVDYGLPMGSRFVGTPRVGFSTSEYGRSYRAGYGLGVLERESLNFELDVDVAPPRESDDRRDGQRVPGPGHAGLVGATTERTGALCADGTIRISKPSSVRDPGELVVLGERKRRTRPGGPRCQPVEEVCSLSPAVQAAWR